MNEPANRGRKQLLLLAAFFLGPLVLAFIVYYGFDWRPAGSTEHGELLQPPGRLPDIELVSAKGDVAPTTRRKWSLIVIADSGCADECHAVLYETRQVRKALSKERDRTQRILRISGEFDRALIELQHPDLVIVTDDMPAAAELAGSLDSLDREYIYLADPLGNLMMRFPRDSGMKAMHTDLKKLLKLSRIG